MIGLRLLHTLRAPAEHGTVNAAAQALHLSPSAVSRRRRQLVRETGAERWSGTAAGSGSPRRPRPARPRRRPVRALGAGPRGAEPARCA
ncbi:helix-turn-helix domain-containing protein [Streptomyces sp. URMC 125]|uniref:helix-turn-helix domain-containing protein n=1 Tax=Streptomyces sp. URMC 125 TaxID=3423419 RepID=UPI003F1B8415